MHPVPSEVNDPIPFAEDRTHDTYVAEHAARFFALLSMVDVVMKEHHAAFRGRSTPAHFFARPMLGLPACSRGTTT